MFALTMFPVNEWDNRGYGVIFRPPPNARFKSSQMRFQETNVTTTVVMKHKTNVQPTIFSPKNMTLQMTTKELFFGCDYRAHSPS
jgi:hypothetical protein